MESKSGKRVALAMIVRGHDDEAEPLKRCLTSVAPFVDGLFITITQPNERVKKVAEFFGAKTFQFDWCKDFAKARNFSFAQVPKDFDYIMWADSDDEFTGMEHLKEGLETSADAYRMFYYYDWDEYGLPTVVHQKTMVIRNDGTFTWKGSVHEDLDFNRDVDVLLLKDIKRLHRTDKKRIDTSTQRNLEIAENDVNLKPDDPRSYWNLANAQWGKGENDKAIESFLKFVAMSESEEEKFVAYYRMANIMRETNPSIAVEYAQRAIGIKPLYPDAYHILGEIYYSMNNLKEAEKMLLHGLQMKPPILEIIAFNPRDYDYNPLMVLSRVYWDMAEPGKTVTCLKSCKEIQPKNKNLDTMIATAEKEAKKHEKVKRYAERFKKLIGEGKLDVFKKEVQRMNDEYRRHPLIAFIYNSTFIKKESTGRDIVYFCGYTTHEWNPDIAKEKGVGGSEEAVIHLSKRLNKLGWNVTIYNNCGEEKEYDGVRYKPWYLFNYRDKQDIAIIWRHPKVVESQPNADMIIVDMHDVIKSGEFNEKRLALIDRVFLKSEAHRRCYPNIPDEKVVIIPNGVVPEDFDKKLERDPFLIINTSSADRSLEAICRIFPKIKAKEPRARMMWAYGFGVFDSTHQSNKRMMDWKDRMVKEMAEAGIENLGKLSHGAIADLTLSAGIYLYPTHFYEIDCISVRKAQLGGCVPVTSDFAALETTNATGTKIHSTRTDENWCPPYAIEFGADEALDDLFVEATLEAFKTKDREMMAHWAKDFNWDNITKQWNAILSKPITK
jgi:tetratricopeptide (TPR) repeat protein